MRPQCSEINLRRLQAAQYRHDQIAHSDILSFSLARRLTHFTLHFAKYAGVLVRAGRTDDTSDVARVLTDTFIIGLAAANTLNVDLREHIPASVLNGKSTEAEFLDEVMNFVEISGCMAKACEAWDHLEDYPSRKVLELNVIKSILSANAMANLVGLDLQDAVFTRWKTVESKCKGRNHYATNSPSELDVALG